MAKTARIQLVKSAFPRVAEGGVAQVVAKGDGLRQVLVQTKGAADGSGDARHFQCVGQARTVVVTVRLQKHLRLVLQTAKGFSVRDAVHVPLETGAYEIRFLRHGAAAGIYGQKAAGPNEQRFLLLPDLSGTGHCGRLHKNRYCRFFIRNTLIRRFSSFPFIFFKNFFLPQCDIHEAGEKSLFVRRIEFDLQVRTFRI